MLLLLLPPLHPSLPHHQLWHPGTVGTQTQGRSCWTQPEWVRGVVQCNIQILCVCVCATDLCELHLVHAFSCVPMQESLATEHSGKLLADTLEQLLDGCAVADEGGSHLEATRGDVANGGLDVVWDPLNKVGAVLVLNVEHLLINFLH